jgi:hypothetical protein
MRWGQSVGAGEIPDEISSATPRIESGAVGSLEIVTKKARRLEFGVDVNGPDSSNNNVVCEGVPPVTSAAATASETVVTVLLNLHATDALVCTNKRGA